jgi:molybdenum cofactor cytidylyltransferase
VKDAPPRLAAIVLAAGYSSRMGAHKPLLPLGGATVLRAAIDTFRDVARDVVVVAGHRAAELEPEVSPSGARLVHNPEFDRGMFTSVVAGVRALPSGVDGAFVLPADIPFVRPHTARLMADAFARGGPEIVHPVFHGRRGHPPLFSARVFRDILAGSDGGLRRVLALHDARAIGLDVFDEGILVDLDTPDDRRRASELRKDRTAPTVAEVVALFDAHEAPAPIRAHGEAVAEVALRFANALAGAGGAVDRDVVRAAAMLHDIAKSLSLKGAPDHARAGARVAAELGYDAVADAIARHTDLARTAGAELDEAALVYLADKMVEDDRLVDLDARERATLSHHGAAHEAHEAILRRYADARDVARALEERTGRSAAHLASGDAEARP